MKLYEQLANAIGARKRCENSDTHRDWFVKWSDLIEAIAKDLPHGSGFDSGTIIDLNKSTEEKLVLHTEFHCMNSDGYYCGWESYTVTVTPSFIGGYNLKITGRDRNDTKDYIADVFSTVLSEEYKPAVSAA